MQSACRRARLGAFLALLPITALPARADVRPNPLVAEGMVLQQNQEVNLWGTADPGEKVVVRFREQEAAATADAAGKWLVRVAAKSAGGPFPLTIAGKNTVELKDVLVGEVWVASGQSNMWWPVASRPGAKELAGTENRQIRLFNVPGKLADVPQDEVAGTWQVCGPDSLVGFSAVAYYFGRQIEATQHVPVGLIHASYGGSGVRAWISARALAEDPQLDAIRAQAAQADQKAEQARARLKPEIERYEAALAKAKRDGTPPPAPPRGLAARPAGHSRLYNGMLAPLQHYGIRGALWYQGEADVSHAGDYQALLGSLIRSWRQEWGQQDFPFLFVQIAPYTKIVDQPQDSGWARVREAQLKTSQTVPHTGMAVITDWGHETDIHVKQKRPVGERLAQVARALVYGEKIPYSGPLYARLTVDGRQAVLGFQHVGSGLTARRMVLEEIITDRKTGQQGGALHVAADQSAGDAPLAGFTLAGQDQKFYPAQAEIRGDQVVVTCPQVDKPVAVRYGWADYPTGNLFNREGFPASPFRTDDW